MDLVKVAVCDDEKALLEMVERYVQIVFDEEKLEVQVDTYPSANVLCKTLEDGANYDIYILDIEMPGMSGIDLGRRLRQELGYLEALVIFSSGHPIYYKDVFEVHPFNFLTKPYDLTTFRTGILDALRIIKSKRGFFEYTANRDKILVRKSRILYLESVDRAIRLVYKDKGDFVDAQYYGPLSEERYQLEPPDFVYPHSAFIVNLNYAIRITRKEITMEDGKTINITRNNAKETRHHIAEFNNHRK